MKPFILENLFRMLSESSSIKSSILRFGVRVFYCRVRVSQRRVRAGVRVFPESGFSSGPSPSPVRVSKYAVCEGIKSINTRVLIFGGDKTGSHVLLLSFFILFFYQIYKSDYIRFINPTQSRVFIHVI